MNRPYAAKLQELVQASYNLPNATCDLGRIELGPVELEEVTHRFYPHEKGGIDAKAHYLLAASGFNAEQVLSEIAHIRIPKPKLDSDAQPGLSGARPDDVGATPRSSRSALAKRPKSVEDDSIINRTSREFDAFVDEHLRDDWAKRKSEVANLLAANSAGTKAGSWGKHRSGNNVGASILGPPSSEATKLTPLMHAYADIVTSLADHEFNMPDLVTKFFDAAVHAQQNSYITDSWQALRLNKATTFLERQYRDHIDAEIKAHRQDAKLGGVPSSFAKIKAYVSLKYFKHDEWDSRLTLVNRTPIWAYLYYLVRAGYLEEALQVVLERTDIFETMGSSFMVFFKAWIDSPTHTLSPHYAQMIHSEYNQLFRPGAHFDPYKQALYKVIGRSDLSHRSLPLVAVTTEDWLWLQLQLVTDNSPYTLTDLRNYILEVGPAHLAQDPYKYFTVLVLLGLHAEALTFLRPHDEVHTVHFAIALVKAGLLGPTARRNSSYNELIGHYTRHFRQSLPSLAVDYLVDIAMPAADEESDAQAREALQELVLETRRFSELLGDVATFSEQTFPGTIEKRMDLVGVSTLKMYHELIIHEAAVKADADGRIVDAILLFRLAGDSERVLQLVNAELGLQLSGVQLGQPVPTNASPDFDVLQLARNMMVIDADALLRSDSRNTTLVLLAISECIDLLANREWQKCLERLSQTGLLVLSPEPAITHVRELALQMTNYDESIARNIPNVLLMGMTCIIHITSDLKTSSTAVASRLIDQYRNRANNCMVYAGLIQFRMPREVYTKLTQLEAQLA